MTSFELRRVAMVAGVLAPLWAMASVGKVSVLEGSATRTPEGGKAVSLKVGDAIELADRLQVATGGNLKLTLTDESVLMVAGGSELRIEEAVFEGQERKGFKAFLSFGKVWASVKKALAGSDAKFEVTTERAVAGVRGTIFRVDAISAMQASNPRPRKSQEKKTVVRVEEGRVAVEARIRKLLAQAGATGTQGTSTSTGAVQKAQNPGKRVQVAGPQQVSAEEWERRFVELQKGMKVEVGESSWDEGSFSHAEMEDAFGRFVSAHRPATH
jgi:hypothetical protein